MELTNFTRQRQVFKVRQGKSRVVAIDLPAHLGGPGVMPKAVKVADEAIAQVLSAGGPGATGLRFLVESEKVHASAPLPSTPRAKA